MMKSYLGVIIACCLLIFSACKKKSTTTTTAPVVPVTTAPAPVDINHAATSVFTLDGTNYTYTEGVNGVLGGTESYKNVNSTTSPVTTEAAYGSEIGNDSLNYFSIQRGTLTYSDVRADTAVFKQAFAPGNMNYSAVHLNGIQIYYFDSSGKLWASDKGTADQTGSVFTVVNSKESYFQGYQEMKIYATFNCKLYDGNGNSKTLTNGKFVGYFENN